MKISSPADYLAYAVRRRFTTMISIYFLVLIATGGLAAYREYEQIWNSAHRDLTDGAAACQMSLTAVLKQSVYSLNGIRDDLGASAAPRAAIPQILRAAMRYDPLSAYLGVQHAGEGEAVLVDHTGSLATLPHLLPRSTGTRIELWQLIQLPGSDHWYLPITLGEPADRSPGDTIFALVSAEDLAASAANYHTLPDSVIGLTTTNGVRLFRFEGPGVLIHVNGPPARPDIAKLMDTVPSGQFKTVNSVTGQLAEFGYSHSPSIPLSVAMSVPVHTLFKLWWRAMLAPIALLFLGVVIVLLFGNRLRLAYGDLRLSVDQQMDTSRRLLDVQETERRALARELHDAVGQQLTALSLNLSLIREAIPETLTDTLGVHLDDSQDLLENTTMNVRDVMVELRPPGLDELGLLAALKDHVQRVSRRSALSIVVEGQEPVPRMPAKMLIALFRVAQEALNNIVKHAQASRATIQLDQLLGVVTLVIEDNGRGFDAGRRAAQGQGGMGRNTMRERAEAIGAELRIDSTPGNGTRISARFTWPPASQEEQANEH